MSDKPLDVYVLYATDTEQRFIKASDDGCLAIFHDEVSAKRAKRRNPGTDYKQVNYYRQKQVDQMQADSKALEKRIAELETMVKVFRGCIETGLTPELMSPCYQKVISLVGRNADDQKERDGD